jgi:hypothetical protein
MITGGCLCGAVRYRAEGRPEMQGLCHCRSCQRVSGGGHVGFLCFPSEAVTVDGETRAYSQRGGSGLMATRLSCPACASALFGLSEAMPGKTNIYAGSLDDPSRFAPEIAVFTRSRQPWDDGSRQLICFETVPAA